MEYERRTSVLTEHDIERLLAAMDKVEEKRLESIGYDLSTPQSRSEIHADHVFVRSFRLGAAKAKVAAIGAFIVSALAAVGHWAITGFVLAVKMGARAP